MGVRGAVAAGRRAAERQMLDTCTVGRVTGETTVDPDTGAVIPVTVSVYEGRCKVQTFEAHEANPEMGGSVATVQRYSVHVPVGAFEPEVGMVVTITAAALDPHLTGTAFRVVALLHKTAATAYRLGVEAS